MRFQTRIFKFIFVVALGLWQVFGDPGVSAGSLEPTEIERLHQEAGELFRQAGTVAETDPEEAKTLYQQSVMRLERIVTEGGIENGKLYYNIGNIYFRMKDLGRALINYRRAEQYIPNDTNLQQNLAYARSIRTDQIEEKQQTKILKVLFFWHYDFSITLRWLFFCGSFVMIWVCASLFLFLRKTMFKWLIVIFVTLSLALAGSLFIEHRYLRQTIPGVIISPEVIARKGNSVSYEKSFKTPLHAGTEFTVIETRGNWLHIELSDSRTCWIPASEVELVR